MFTKSIFFKIHGIIPVIILCAYEVTGINDTVALKDSCVHNEECYGIQHAKCSADKICTCMPNNIMVNETFCQPLLGSFCWKGEKCATDHASCIDNECQCNENFIQQSNRCLPVIFGLPCNNDSTCEVVPFAKCFKSKICGCSFNTLAVNRTTCLPVLNVHCKTNVQCKVSNSVCIENECKCKPLYKAISNTECREPYLGMTCERFADCDSFITHSECSVNNECECIRNHRAVNSHTCAPLFNVSCWNGEPCATKMSICFDNQCQCKPYYKYLESQCVPVMLGMSCRTHTDCQGIEFSTCSNDKTCVCKSNYVKSNLATCSPLIGGDCISDNNCVAENSYCFRNKCRCAVNHFAHSNDLCTPISLKKSCNIDNDCENITNSYCSNDNECFCQSDYIALNGRECTLPLGKFCTESNPCLTENSICTNNECQCSPNFVKHFNAECKPIKFKTSCSNNSDCTDIGQECSSHRKCICKENFIALNGMKCAPLLNGYCSKNNDCYVENSVCIANRCQCDFDHLPHFNYECESVMLGKFCSEDIDCRRIKNSRCSADKVCVCRMNYFALDKFLCLPTLHGFCSDDHDCYSDSFHCSDNQCQCKSNHTAVSVDKCVETHSLSYCTDVSECSDSWHSTCLPEGKCVCASNNIALIHSVCLPILDGYCWKDNQCIAENSVCIDFRCQCKTNFIAVAINQCLLIKKKKI